MIRAIIFDLDNCLSAADEVGEELFKPVFDAIRQTNHGRFSKEALAAVAFDCWRHPLDWVANKHGFSADMLAAAWAASTCLEVSSTMRGYPDLGMLPELAVRRFLVTSGFRRLQESKIRALGFARLFEGVYVDAIDEPNRKGKQRIFAEILDRFRLRPEDVLVVGDSPDSEIEAGNTLGMATVQILRPGVPRGGKPTHTIKGLAELKVLMMQDRAS
jgi:FMN phosphatase YigB (HAD superfamily)